VNPESGGISPALILALAFALGVVAVLVVMAVRRGSSTGAKSRDVVGEPHVPAPAVPAAPRGRNVVVAIGIDDYAEWPMLSNAKRDAEGALAAFTRLGFEALAPPLLNGDATAEAIHAMVVDELRKLSPNDSLVVFFAGHGHTVTEKLDDGTVVKTGYIMPVDAHKPGGSQMRWIRLDTWLSQVSRLLVRHVLVIIDACHSGIAIESLIKHRGTSSDGLAALRARRSRRVIASALDDQRALDGGPISGHSLFTGYLIEGLIDLMKRGPVTGSELGLYVQQRVRTHTKAAQTPDFGSLELDARGELVIEPVAEVVAQPPASGASK
jgi:uncharacterized caspase-like protein